MKNIILFPGSFDPIHIGHLEMAKKASELLNADVIFVPAVISVWKTDSAPFVHKMNMIELMIKNEERFSVSDYENTTGKEINYSIDTVRYFKSIYPEDNLYLLIGEDQVNAFHKWKEAKEISNIAKIIFFQRPDIEIDMNNYNTFNMKELTGVLIDASSSNIRELKVLDTSDEIVDYIAENRLYYMSEISKRITEERMNHSIEVAKLARLIAEKNNLDKSTAYIAGLLHDVGKSPNKAYLEEEMTKHYKDYLDIPAFSYHQFVGEYVAKHVFNIEDEEVLKAIKFHATGCGNMSTLGKIVYSSDKIEPTRGFDSSDLIKACLENCEAGFVEVLRANREYLTSCKKDINNRLTAECFAQYLN